MTTANDMMTWTTEQFDAFADLHGLRPLKGLEIEWWNTGFEEEPIPPQVLLATRSSQAYNDFRRQMIYQYLGIIRTGMCSGVCHECVGCRDRVLSEMLVRRSEPIDIPIVSEVDWSNPLVY